MQDWNRRGGSRTRLSSLATLVALLVAAACGGQAVEEGGGGGQQNVGSASNGGQGGGKAPSNGEPLGECVPGFNPDNEPSRPCAWIADDLCYDTKPAACACDCPRDKKNSLCLSGFDDGPNGRVRVNCS